MFLMGIKPEAQAIDTNFLQAWRNTGTKRPLSFAADGDDDDFQVQVRRGDQRGPRPPGLSDYPACLGDAEVGS